MHLEKIIKYNVGAEGFRQVSVSPKWIKRNSVFEGFEHRYPELISLAANLILKTTLTISNLAGVAISFSKKAFGDFEHTTL